MAGTGGKREGAGRKTKADEEKANYLFSTALKRIYSQEDDDEAKIEFIQDLNKTTRGKIFIAEHLFGKAPNVVDLTGGGLPVQFDFNKMSDEELDVLIKLHGGNSKDTNTTPDKG